MAKKEKEDKGAQAWATFFDMLTPAAKDELSSHATGGAQAVKESPPAVGDEETEQFRSFRASLSDLAASGLDELADDGQEPEPNPNLTRHCLIECPDGDWAMVRMFKTAEGLARRMSQLEGEDVVAWPITGVPMRFTKGPQRYLILPDGQTALTIPMTPDGPVRQIDADLIDGLELQDDGYLGPPELAHAHAVSKGKAPAKKPQHDDDDDDEDDDDA